MNAVKAEPDVSNHNRKSATTICFRLTTPPFSYDSNQPKRCHPNTFFQPMTASCVYGCDRLLHAWRYWWNDDVAAPIGVKKAGPRTVGSSQDSLISHALAGRKAARARCWPRCHRLPGRSAPADSERDDSTQKVFLKVPYHLTRHRSVNGSCSVVGTLLYCELTRSKFFF